MKMLVIELKSAGYSLQEYTQSIKKHTYCILFPRQTKCLTPNMIKGIVEHIYYHVIGRHRLLRPEFLKQVASVIFNSSYAICLVLYIASNGMLI
jgi:hypothetical protein